MKNKFLLPLSACLLISLSACGNGNEGGDTPDILPDSPSYNGGLAGDEALDQVNTQNDTNIETLLENVTTKTKYTYEVNVAVGDINEHFVQYFTPNAWYCEYGTSDDFGYAQTYKGHKMFKYYINDDATEVYPSIYEYAGYNENSIVTELYSAFTIANIGQIEGTLDTLKDDGYQSLGGNNYIILDSETMSVFQFMSTYGSSIASFINSFYIQIVDLDSCIFETTLDLGSYGTITGKFTPVEETKIDFVNDAVINDGLDGVASYPEVSEVTSLLDRNNFTMKGVSTIDANGVETNPTTTIYCTNDYFVYDYESEEYEDFGFAFIKANTEVPVYPFDSETGELSSTPTLMSHPYDSCYEFVLNEDGSITFMNFNGPMESETTKYLEVSELPNVGDPNIIYILKNGGESVYTYTYDEETNKWKPYSEWYDTVGDFYVYNLGATFYLSSTAFTALAPSLFEVLSPENPANHKYFSSNLDMTSALANGIFGWGFQPTNTWMENITKAYLNINYDSNNALTSFDLGLGVLASLNGGPFAEQKIFYNYSSFGTTSFESVENALNELYGE